MLGLIQCQKRESIKGLLDRKETWRRDLEGAAEDREVKLLSLFQVLDAIASRYSKLNSPTQSQSFVPRALSYPTFPSD